MIHLGYFTVADAAIGGTFGDVFSVSLDQGQDEIGDVVLANVDGEVYDILGGPFSSVSIQIIDTGRLLCLFAGVTSRDIFRTAYLSCTRARPVLSNALYYDGYQTVAGDSCSTSDSTILGFGTRSDGCLASLTKDNTGSGVVTTTMEYDSEEIDVDWRVWFPETFDFRTDNNVTQLNRINTPWAALGDIVYEAVRVWTYAMFECDGQGTTDFVIGILMM